MKFQGLVKWFDEKRGYGFIEDETGKDHFVHYTGIAGKGHKVLKENQKVTFETEEKDGRSRATDVQVIEG